MPLEATFSFKPNYLLRNLVCSGIEKDEPHELDDDGDENVSKGICKCCHKKHECRSDEDNGNNLVKQQRKGFTVQIKPTRNLFWFLKKLKTKCISQQEPDNCDKNENDAKFATLNENLCNCYENETQLVKVENKHNYKMKKVGCTIETKCISRNRPDHNDKHETQITKVENGDICKKKKIGCAISFSWFLNLPFYLSNKDDFSVNNGNLQEYSDDETVEEDKNKEVENYPNDDLDKRLDPDEQTHLLENYEAGNPEGDPTGSFENKITNHSDEGKLANFKNSQINNSKNENYEVDYSDDDLSRSFENETANHSNTSDMDNPKNDQIINSKNEYYEVDNPDDDRTSSIENKITNRSGTGEMDRLKNDKTINSKTEKRHSKSYKSNSDTNKIYVTESDSENISKEKILMTQGYHVTLINERNQRKRDKMIPSIVPSMQYESSDHFSLISNSIDSAAVEDNRYFQNLKKLLLFNLNTQENYDKNFTLHHRSSNDKDNYYSSTSNGVRKRSVKFDEKNLESWINLNYNSSTDVEEGFYKSILKVKCQNDKKSHCWRENISSGDSGSEFCSSDEQTNEIKSKNNFFNSDKCNNVNLNNEKVSSNVNLIKTDTSNTNKKQKCLNSKKVTSDDLYRIGRSNSDPSIIIINPPLNKKCRINNRICNHLDNCIRINTKEKNDITIHGKTINTQFSKSSHKNKNSYISNSDNNYTYLDSIKNYFHELDLLKIIKSYHQTFYKSIFDPDDIIDNEIYKESNGNQNCSHYNKIIKQNGSDKKNNGNFFNHRNLHLYCDEKSLNFNNVHCKQVKNMNKNNNSSIKYSFSKNEITFLL